MVEDYVETCGYKFSATNPEYKLKSPGGTGEEDKELKENAGVPNKMRAGFKKLKNKEGLSIEERDELYKAYKGIVELMTYGNFYDNKKPNKRRKELSELTFDINYALVGSKRLGSYQGRFEKILKKFLNMINTQIKREEKGLKTDYRKAIRASKLDDVKNIFKNTTKYARTQKGIQKGTNEGFGSDESLTKTEKKKFEKERLENAEVLGYKLTGKKDMKEAITGSTRKNLLKIGKEIKNNLFRINPGLKKVKDNRLLIRGLANTFMFMRYTPDNANYQNYKKYFPKNFKSSSVQKLANILQNERDTVRKTFFKQIVKETKDLKEAVDEGDFISAIQSIQAGLDEAEYGFNDLGRLKGMSSSEKRIVKTLFSRFKVLMRGVEKARRVITRESINEDGHTDVPSAVRKLKTSIEDALQIIGYLKKVNDTEPLPSWWTDKVTLSSNYLNTARNYILNPHESVFAVRQDKIKDDERYAKEPNFDYDPEKGKSRIRKVNEMTTSQARDTLNHLGGKRFMVMTGAKPLTIDKKRKELLFKIGRNAKGINLVTIRLTSLDLYDMEFAQVRMGNKKVKAVEKRVYGDQLQKFFKKHTGMNTYL
jgi:hypothetical protein